LSNEALFAALARALNAPVEALDPMIAAVAAWSPYFPPRTVAAVRREAAGDWRLADGSAVAAEAGGPAALRLDAGEVVDVVVAGDVWRLYPAGAPAGRDVALAFRRAERAPDESLDRIFTAGAAFVGLAAARRSEHAENAARTAALVEAEKLAALGRLMAGVVHELGGPLQSIISLADVLERDPDREDRLESARRILRSALRCKQIAQELLAFARKNPARMRRVDPRTAVLDALELDRFADVGDVEFKFEEPEGPAEVVCDPQRLAQVVLNLLSNARGAVAATGKRGVVRVLLDRIDGRRSRLAVRPGATVVRIAVEDRGPGVPPDLRARVFDAFVTTKPEGRGTGLGLFVARQMIEEAGGALYLDESHSPGARFVVELPAASPAPASDLAPAEPPRAGLRILVVDDDRDVLETYQVVLALDRHEVTACDRGLAALAACEAQDFDAVLCDVRLPDLDGRRFLAELTKKKPHLAARVVFATGDVTAPETQELLASLPQPSLQKPFRIEELEAALRAVAPSPGVRREGGAAGR
jgi:signal transduction histidine kinase/CheY-like chemotaxis protein